MVGKKVRQRRNRVKGFSGHGYWLKDEDFDESSLNADERLNPWDYWVGNSTVKELMSGHRKVETAVEDYMRQIPKAFPEAARTVSYEWLYKKLLKNAEQQMKE